MACQAELTAYNNALALKYQAGVNLAAAQANDTAATALVNFTWQAYQACLAGQGGGGGPGGLDLPHSTKARPKRKRKRGS